MAARRIVIEFLGKDKSLGSTATAVESKTSRLGGTLKKVGLIAGGILVAGAGLAGKALFSAGQKASDLNETLSKSQQIFGHKSANKLAKWADDAAASIGQSKQTALDAAATFGVFGKSAGLTGDKLVGFSTKMTSLASDMASFNNTSPEEAIEAIGAALRGESEPIRKYGVLLDDATLRQQAMKMGLIDTVKTALTPSQKVLAAQAAILKQTSDQQGDFARTSDGLANRQRIISAQWENMQAKLGQKVLPIMVAVAGFVLNRLLPALGNLSSFLQAKLTPIFTRLAVFVQTRVIPAFRAAAQWAKQNLVPALAGVAQFVQGRLIPALSNLWNWFVTKIVPAIARALVPVLRGAKAAFDQVKAALERNAPQIDRVRNALRTMAEFVAQRVAPVLAKLAQFWLTKVTGPALSATIDLLGGMVDAVSWLVDKISSLVSWLGRIKVPSALREAAGLIGSVAGKVPGFARGGVTPGGVAEVGERGREFAFFPRGTRIVSNQDARRALAGGAASHVTINMYGVLADEAAVGRALERVLIKYQRDTGRPLQVTTI